MVESSNGRTVECFNDVERSSRGHSTGQEANWSTREMFTFPFPHSTFPLLRVVYIGDNEMSVVVAVERKHNSRDEVCGENNQILISICFLL